MYNRRATTIKTTTQGNAEVQGYINTENRTTQRYTITNLIIIYKEELHSLIYLSEV